MSRKTILICDRCKDEKSQPVQPIFIQTGWEPDPAGGSSNAAGDEVDLCPACMRHCLRAALKLMPDFAGPAAVLKEVAKWPRKTLQLP